MTHRLAPFVTSFSTNAWLFGTAVQSIPEKEAGRRLHERVNCARNIAMHIVAARHALCTLLGSELEPLPWGDIGEGFEAGFKAGAAQPELGAVLAAWNRLEPRFGPALLSASDEVLARPSPLPIPGLAQPTMADFAAINVVHESYHLGQLGLIVKAVTGQGIMRPTQPASA